jgi:hypothetical protein
MRAEKRGLADGAAQIVQMVAQAQRSRAPMQRMADVVAGWFVVGVVAIALLTFLGWGLFGPEPSWVYGLINAVAVLIIACPARWAWPRRCRSWSPPARRDARRAVPRRGGDREPAQGRHADRGQDRHADRGQAGFERAVAAAAAWMPRTRCCAWPPASTRAASIRWRRPSSPRRAQGPQAGSPRIRVASGIGVRGTVGGDWRSATPR